MPKARAETAALTLDEVEVWMPGLPVSRRSHHHGMANSPEMVSCICNEQMQA